MFFDLIVTAGVYALVGFEVTPATVIGLLTILGFSIYDTVIVFDKVEENTAGFEHTTRRTFAEQANLAVNQTFMRSINTSLISALPIIALMVIAVWLLGVGTCRTWPWCSWSASSSVPIRRSTSPPAAGQPA
jgi:preprotein translocase subunit SecF